MYLRVTCTNLWLDDRPQHYWDCYTLWCTDLLKLEMYHHWTVFIFKLFDLIYEYEYFRQNTNTNRILSTSLLKISNKSSTVPNDTLQMYLVYNYVHILKNIRTNCIRDPQHKLSFQLDGTEYKACWKDILHLYETDSKTQRRMTKLTHTAVLTKVLQRQSVPLVCKVFDDKTVAAFEAVKDNFALQPGTVKFVKLITSWFQMMNVKHRYTCSFTKVRDDSCKPWKLDCDSFENLESMCNVVSTCRWEDTGKRCRKLTKFTAEAFVVSTKFNITAATKLLTSATFFQLFLHRTHWRSSLGRQDSILVIIFT